MIIASFLLVFLNKSDANSVTLYFLSETEDYDGNPTGSFSNIFPHTYKIKDKKIIHSFLNSEKSFNNCKINDLNNWECLDNQLIFGLKKIYLFF